MRVRIEIEIDPARRKAGWESKKVLSTVVQVSETGQPDTDDPVLASAITQFVNYVLQSEVEGYFV